MRHRGVLRTTDPVQDSALNAPLGGILDDVIIWARPIRSSLISTEGNPGVLVGFVGLDGHCPVVALHVDRHEFDVGVIEVDEGRRALRRMANHIDVHVGRLGLGLGRNFVATLTLLY